MCAARLLNVSHEFLGNFDQIKGQNSIVINHFATDSATRATRKFKEKFECHCVKVAEGPTIKIEFLEFQDTREEEPPACFYPIKKICS